MVKELKITLFTFYNEELIQALWDSFREYVIAKNPEIQKQLVEDALNEYFEKSFMQLMKDFMRNNATVFTSYKQVDEAIANYMMSGEVFGLINERLHNAIEEL